MKAFDSRLVRTGLEVEASLNAFAFVLFARLLLRLRSTLAGAVVAAAAALLVELPLLLGVVVLSFTV